MADCGITDYLPGRDRAEERVFHADPMVLLAKLEHFAREGTFASTTDIRPRMAMLIAKAVDAEGGDYQTKVKRVQRVLSVSERTAQRLIQRKV